MRLYDDHNYGVDIRREDELGWRGDNSVDISSQKIKDAEKAIHNRLLNQATNGRLMWRDNQIVRA